MKWSFSAGTIHSAICVGSKVNYSTSDRLPACASTRRDRSVRLFPPVGQDRASTDRYVQHLSAKQGRFTFSRKAFFSGPASTFLEIIYKPLVEKTTIACPVMLCVDSGPDNNRVWIIEHLGPSNFPFVDFLTSRMAKVLLAVEWLTCFLSAQ